MTTNQHAIERLGALRTFIDVHAEKYTDVDVPVVEDKINALVNQLQAAEDALARLRVVVLDERQVDAVFGVSVPVPGLDEEPAGITVHGRCDDEDARQVGLGYSHGRAYLTGGP